MTPVFLNPSSSSSSTTSFCHDLEVHDFQDDQQHLKLFLSPYNVEEGRSSSSLAPSPTNYYSYEYSRIVNPDQTSDVVVQSHQHHDGQKAKIDFGKSRRNKLVVYRNFENTTSREAQDEDQNSEIFGKNVNNNITNSSDGSVKYWMSSKMRLIQKMSNLPDQPEWPATTTFSGTTSTASAHIINDSDHHHGQRAQEKSELLPLHSPNKDNKAQLTFNSYNTTASGAVIRVCSDCNTTTTPLWRSGPRGPKSLCNACGIRQRKARRAMAAAAAATATAAAADSADTNLPIKITHNYKAHNNNNNVMIKEKKFRGNNSIGHYKGKFKLKVVNTANSASSVGKRERINSNDDNKLCFGDFASFGLNENNCSAFQGVQFPRDVAEAAILLMELSNCHGFVHS